MTNLLLINSSLNGDDGNSSKLANYFVETYAEQASGRIVKRDLSKSPIPHLTAQEMQAWMTDVSERDETQNSLAAISDNLVEEVKSAELIVLGVPMYNFGIPSDLKAWIDRIARAGVTFKYTENGPVGLLENKKVIVLSARGGMYAGTPKDTQTQYLIDFFNFVGITDIEFIYTEGLAMGPESYESAWQSTLLKINQKIIELNDGQAD